MSKPRPKAPVDMPENPHAAQAFLREVDDSLHYENMMNLWQKHKNKVFALVGLAFIATAGAEGYKIYSAQQLENQANIYWQNLAKDATSMEMLENSQQLSGGFAFLTTLKASNKLLQEGKIAEAVEGFNKISQDKSLSADYTDLAKLYSAQAQMQSSPEVAETILKSLIESNSSYSATAYELLANLAENSGDINQAIVFYDSALTAKDASAVLKNRALSRATYLRQVQEQNKG